MLNKQASKIRTYVCYFTKYHETSNQIQCTKRCALVFINLAMWSFFLKIEHVGGEKREKTEVIRETPTEQHLLASLSFSHLLFLERNKADKRLSYSLD